MSTPVRSRQIRTGLITAVSVFVAILVLLILSAIDNPDGTPWLESSLIGQTLAMLGVVAAAVLPSLLATRRDVAVARDQLENTHVDAPGKISNVRDDIDHKHDALVDLVNAFSEKMEHKFDGVYAEFRGMRRDIGRAADQADRAAQAAGRVRDTVDEVKEVVDQYKERLGSVEAKIDGIVEATTGTIPLVDPQEES